MAEKTAIPGVAPTIKAETQEASEESAEVPIAKPDDMTQEQLIAKTAQEELNKLSESDGDFTKKKKW